MRNPELMEAILHVLLGDVKILALLQLQLAELAA